MKAEIAKSIDAAQEVLEEIIYVFRNSVDNANHNIHRKVDFEKILLPAHKGLLASSSLCKHNREMRTKLNQAMTSIAKAQTWWKRQAERGSDFYHFNDIIDNYYCEAKAQLAIAKAHCEFIEV